MLIGYAEREENASEASRKFLDTSTEFHRMVEITYHCSSDALSIEVKEGLSSIHKFSYGIAGYIGKCKKLQHNYTLKEVFIEVRANREKVVRCD